MPEMDVVGKPCVSVGSQDIVTGIGRYCSDLRFPGMLVGKLLYSSYPCARIMKIDVRKARALEGVVAVLTHNDIPGENSYLYDVPDQPLLVYDRVRYQGDALAAVAAENEDVALAALEAIEVEYETVQGVFDPLEAMKPGAPQVWPGRNNVCSHTVIDYGDIEAGFEIADVIIDETYHTQLVEHAFLETECAVAYIDEDGSIVVYAGCQAPYRDRSQIARTLAIPEAKVRVIVPYNGGAFGGKDEAHVQIHAALLANATGRPVRLLRTREESILTHVKRHPVIIRYRSGATREGLLTAIHAEAIGDTGPYVNAGPRVMNTLATTLCGPYFVPNAHLEAYTVFTNNPISGAFRGFGIPQANFAFEAQMDTLARKVGIDPLEIRLRNGLDTGKQVPTGAVIREGRGMKASLREVAHLSGWEARQQEERLPAPHLRRGWGMASSGAFVCYGRNLPDHAGALLEMAPDGSVVLRTGATDMGQGTHTALTQIAAEALGVELSSVRLIGPDTDKTVDAGAAVASRSVFVSGNAVLQAAQPIRQSLLETAAEETGFPIEVLNLRKSNLYAEGELININISELATKAWERCRQLHAHGFYAVEYPEDFPEDGYQHAPVIPSFGAQVAKVLVDIETGQITLEELVVVHEAGRIINPGGAYGQISGACTMGLGYALMEELLVDHGRTLNTSLNNYLIPTALDVPEMKIKILEIPEPYAPLGAKGLGEPPIDPVAPAILNAVSDAIGVPLTRIPLTPERVLAAIEGEIEI